MTDTERSRPFSIPVTPPAEPPAPLRPVVVATEGDPHYQRVLDQGRAARAREVEAEARLPAPSRPRRRSGLGRLLAAIAVLIAALVVVDGYGFLKSRFEDSLLLGGLFTLLIGAVLWALARWLGEELRGFRALGRVSALQEQARGLLASDGSSGEGARCAARIEALYRDRADLAPLLERFHEVHADTHSDGDVLRLFEQEVLRPVDQRVYRTVARYGAETAVLTALSPFASLDALLSAWRNLRMMREVATLYGARPGVAGTVALLRHVLESLMVAGAAEYLSEGVAEAFGGQLTSVLLARAGQGVTNGMMTARLGLVTARLCRPVPFAEDQQPGIKQIRKEILARLRQALTGAAA